MIIRKAISTDLKSIWAIRTAAIKAISEKYYTRSEIETWSSTPPPANFKDVITKLNWHVVEYQGEIIGCGFIDLDNSEIGGIFVDPHFQRNGVGIKILNVLEQFAKNHHLHCLYLDSTVNAESFYKAAGFNPIKKSKYKHISGTEFDCIRMTKIL
jgi:putative acetyltransferase